MQRNQVFILSKNLFLFFMFLLILIGSELIFPQFSSKSFGHWNNSAFDFDHNALLNYPPKDCDF